MRFVSPLGHVQCLSDRGFYSLVLKVYFCVLDEEQRGGDMSTQSSGRVVKEWFRGSKSDILKVHTWLCFMKLNGDRTE